MTAVPRILVLEDSPIVALDIEEELKRLSYEEVVVVMDVPAAMAALDAGDFDCALLDYGVGEETAEAVAARLRERGTAFAWISGREFGGAMAEPVLDKPFTGEELAETIAKLLDGRQRETG